jgi:hypothetical protein
MESITQEAPVTQATVEAFPIGEFCELRNCEPNVCVYCGLPADSVDHVIPRLMRNLLADVGGWRERWPRITDTVWACRQCNSTAGGKLFDTVAEKRRYIHARYREKHARLLKTPDWTDDEIEALGPSLQQYMRTMRDHANLLRERLAWPRVYEA